MQTNVCNPYYLTVFASLVACKTLKMCLEADTFLSVPTADNLDQSGELKLKMLSQCLAAGRKIVYFVNT